MSTKDKLIEIDFRISILKELKKKTNPDGFTKLITELEEKKTILLTTN